MICQRITHLHCSLLKAFQIVHTNKPPQFNYKIIIITITKKPPRNRRFKVSTHAQTKSYNQLVSLLIIHFTTRVDHDHSPNPPLQPLWRAPPEAKSSTRTPFAHSGRCLEWCASHSQIRSIKCTWPDCSKCDECAAGDSMLSCAVCRSCNFLYFDDACIQRQKRPPRLRSPLRVTLCLVQCHHLPIASPKATC